MTPMRAAGKGALNSPPTVGGTVAGGVLRDVLREPWGRAGVGRGAVRQGRVPDDEVACACRDAPGFGGEVDVARVDAFRQTLQPSVDSFVEPRDDLERALLGGCVG